jgi:predicted nuclease of predicted toxin-antitoxin system
VRLLVDMNLAPAWVAYPTAAGHEATHWSSITRGRGADP